MKVTIIRTTLTEKNILETTKQVFNGTLKEAKSIAGKEFNANKNLLFVAVTEKTVGTFNTFLKLQKDSTGKMMQRYSI